MGVLSSLPDAREVDTTKARELVVVGGEQRKGRAFRAHLLASIEADAMWSGGDADTNAARPVWAMFAASEDAMRPFLANLRLGRAAEFVDEKRSGYSRKACDRVELLKSAGYHFSAQREACGTIVTAWLPDLFALDPGMVESERVRFVCAPSRAWLARQRVDVRAAVGHALSLPGVPRKGEEADAFAARLPELAVTAHLFAAMLDRRTRAPIIADAAFYLRLLVACLREGLAAWPHEDKYYREFGRGGKRTLLADGCECVGLSEPIAFDATHVAFEALLAAETRAWFDARHT